ncbi:MAG: radical SAM protein [Elusimicrobia bacterium]|nr:radical SAM protein [Elusimicrobiota bacterium]
MRTYELLLGYACNAKCGFCYNPPLTPEVLAQEISLRRAAGLLTKARAEGYEGVWFTGGDPTVHKELPKLLLLARKLGFERIQIGTNAVRLADAAYARKLTAAGLNYARVSLHAASAPLHDELLVLPGAFDAAVKAIANLRALGVYVGVNFVVTARNYKELPAFFRFCVGTLDIRDFDVIFLHHRGMMELNAPEHSVRYSDAAPYLREAFKVYDELGSRPETPTLINVPPCVVPELEPWIADWSTDSTGDGLAQPQDLGIDLHEMKASQRAKAPACAKCSLDKRCLGFEPEYARRYGEKEFAPC